MKTDMTRRLIHLNDDVFVQAAASNITGTFNNTCMLETVFACVSKLSHEAELTACHVEDVTILEPANSQKFAASWR